MFFCLSWTFNIFEIHVRGFVAPATICIVLNISENSHFCGQCLPLPEIVSSLPWQQAAVPPASEGLPLSVSLCHSPLSAASGVSLSSPLCSRPASSFNQKPRSLVPINTIYVSKAYHFIMLIGLCRIQAIESFCTFTMHCVSFFKSI